MPNTEAIVRFTAGQELKPDTFPIGAKALYTYSISPTSETEVYVNIAAYFEETLIEKNWFARIVFTGSIELWEKFYVDSRITYNGTQWHVDEGKQLSLA